MSLRADEWLSRVLGFPVHVGDEPAPGLVYAKVATRDVERVAELEAVGFRVVDVNVTLERLMGAPADGGDVFVEPARPDQHEALVDIAGRAFRWSRFHLDPLIPNELADRVKREWVRSYVTGTRGSELLAAADGGRAVGFLAVLADGEVRVIDLIAVAPEAQGRGVGSALVAELLRRHPGCERIRVGTQAANVDSLRFYERHGFAVAASDYVLHRHG